MKKLNEQIQDTIDSPFGICTVCVNEDDIWFMWNGENSCTVNGVVYSGSIRLNKNGTMTSVTLDKWTGTKHKKTTEPGLRKIREKMYSIAIVYWQSKFWDNIDEIKRYNEIYDLKEKKLELMSQLGTIQERLEELST